MENFPPNFVDNFLQLHNQYRVTHTVPPLEFDEELSEFAQKWANILSMMGVSESDEPEFEYGANIFVSTWKRSERELKPSDPLELWYRESRYFKYGVDQVPNIRDVCHFTQMIWKESKTIGFGLAYSSDERIYFICIYDPSGNIQGEFGTNVLPAEEEEQTEEEPPEPPRKDIEIGTTEKRPEVVKSMERLYAVPSEKLRVWSVWLTKVTEIADEWQKWLRAHIDFIVRLSDNLYAAELIIRQSRVEIVQLKKAESEEVRRTEAVEVDFLIEAGDSARGERGEGEGTVYEEIEEEEETQYTETQYVDEILTVSKATLPVQSSDEVVQPEDAEVNSASETTEKEESETTEKEESETTEKEESETTEKEASATSVKEASATSVKEASATSVKEASATSVKEETTPSVKEETTPSVKEETTPSVKEASKTSVKEPSKTSVKSKDKTEEKPVDWPIGMRWKPTGDADSSAVEEEFEKLPLPRNEEEMEEFLKKFTHQATIYRSYYKHWKETAEQATKEIGGRLVMPTYLVQGKDKTGRIKMPPRPKVQSSKVNRKARAKRSVSKSKKKSKKKSAKPKEESKSGTATNAEESESAAATNEEESANETETNAEESANETDTNAEESANETDTNAEESANETETNAEESANETETNAEAAAKKDSSKKSKRKPSKGSVKKRSKARLSKESQKEDEAPDWVRNCARALEPIPYIFYVRAEPDIGIALEHDDEEVILADPDREHIVANKKRLYFNLNDKPCTSGMPWL